MVTIFGAKLIMAILLLLLILLTFSAVPSASVYRGDLEEGNWYQGYQGQNRKLVVNCKEGNCLASWKVGIFQSLPRAISRPPPPPQHGPIAYPNPRRCPPPPPRHGPIADPNPRRPSRPQPRRPPPPGHGPIIDPNPRRRPPPPFRP